MKKSKKNKNVDNKEDNMSFFAKVKTDKQYSAKIQFLGYGLLILLVVLFLNISNTEGNISNTVSNTENVNDVVEEEEISLLESLSDNYEYDVSINITKVEGIENNYRYYGKSYEDNVIINKVVSGSNSIYYNIDGYYYIKNENNEYGLIQSNLVYDLVDSKYIEVNDVLSLIEKASLEHVVDSSTGAKESVYNLLVRDVVISNKSDDKVTIKVVEETDKLSINIDYTNLMKVFDNTIEKCEISYGYTNIGGVEEFSIIENNNLDE